MPKRIPENVRYEVLSCIMPYLPPRSQARFRAVSKVVGEMVPSTVSTPVYAHIIENHAACIHKNKFEGITDLFVQEEGGITKDIMFFTTCDLYNGDKVNVNLWVEGKAFKISNCKKENFKYIMYRAIEKNKKLTLKKGAVSNLVQAFRELSDGYTFIER
jgi:hypothetical protein